MNKPTEPDLIELLRAFLSHYPTMRFGQAVCAVAAWDNGDPLAASDESLVSEIKQNLETNFGRNAYEVANSSMSDELATALREVRRLQPTVPLGKLLEPLVVRNKWNIYDLENDELIVALQAEISAAPEGTKRGQPISA